ncbi:folate-binding protein YgfZ [Methylomonas sp. LL1]|uniref:CAF17-like 4Fe-4S cluster assembly/insertion protein YgfZ n=1 Tax=Methylomonas sp. LL1 TaxID=2785785 RepID=UPI0018C3FB5C|nr:folate-binding protein YgfZ [Methylomonas sp. LL1]QPK63273.1 folate-binding protein YgfZ [Methylomonas sp. LL1]
MALKLRPSNYFHQPTAMTADNREANPANILYKLEHLAAIEVTGEDASPFLQGQLTCNINEITDTKASIAAFCNPKGRVISTLLIIKTQPGYILLLPRSLSEKVLTKLRIYVLRSKVHLTDKNDLLMLWGLYRPDPMEGFSLPDVDFHCSSNETLICIKLPSPAPRFLCITPAQAGPHPFAENFNHGSCDEWRYGDISAGLPWFEAEQSEQYIPQMLTIDQLGGVSFDKGCYTGQEIVARTHYLGKAKRHLFLAECNRCLRQASDFAVKDAETQEKLGDILTMQALGGTTRLLLVLQTVDGETKNLILDDLEHTPLTLTPFK